MKCSYIDIHTHRDTTATTISTIGLHPRFATSGQLPRREEIEVVDAVGEIGLDYACNVDKQQQLLIFEQQLDLAEEFNKPVVLHCVRAFEQVMQCLRKRQLAAVIFHGFIGSQEQARQAIEKKYFLSFGDRTFKSAKTIRALLITPPELLFIETDESTSSIETIYTRIAALRNTSIKELLQTTNDNYCRIFSKKIEEQNRISKTKS